ncbi:hypothetical protein [Ornithinibacillus scapharcae]|uniref:hypothetical protein n=1 Tax=Ornithinibacillus scapharcae TaxID=1147159 RepID=UPI000225BC34|nr:hypothetical protein [Ornithinibacillus scapharcae]
MKNTRKDIKSQLDKELEQFQFSKKDAVINRLYPLSWKAKLQKLWNTEVTIPLVPVSAFFVLLIMGIGYMEMKPTNESNLKDDAVSVLVVVADNYYWKNDIERVLQDDEN